MKRILLSLAAALCMCASAAAQTVAPFKDGDRAVFLGNSITDGGHYHSYIWLYYMTRFPYMDLRVMNAGIGGETAGDMYKRLDGDVFSKRPTVLTVTFGMNDTGYMEYNGDDAGAFGEKKYRECYDNFKKMEKRLQILDGVRVVMLGSSGSRRSRPQPTAGSSWISAPRWSKSAGACRPDNLRSRCRWATASTRTTTGTW